MSAMPQALAADLRPMRESDLDAVMAVELQAYPFPWTHGIFRDCLLAGYPMWVQERGGRLVGYGVLSVAAGEAHVLNHPAGTDFEGFRIIGDRLLDLRHERVESGVATGGLADLGEESLI